jgi:hypothetical protein
VECNRKDRQKNKQDAEALQQTHRNQSPVHHMLIRGPRRPPHNIRFCRRGGSGAAEQTGKAKGPVRQETGRAGPLVN